MIIVLPEWYGEAQDELMRLVYQLADKVNADIKLVLDSKTIDDLVSSILDKLVALENTDKIKQEIEQMDKAREEVKRGRGRPRKGEIVIKQPKIKRPRGRPKGCKDSEPRKKKGDKVIVKRGRGKPKKSTANVPKKKLLSKKKLSEYDKHINQIKQIKKQKSFKFDKLKLDLPKAKGFENFPEDDYHNNDFY